MPQTQEERFCLNNSLWLSSVDSRWSHRVDGLPRVRNRSTERRPAPAGLKGSPCLGPQGLYFFLFSVMQRNGVFKTVDDDHSDVFTVTTSYLLVRFRRKTYNSLSNEKKRQSLIYNSLFNDGRYSHRKASFQK